MKIGLLLAEIWPKASQKADSGSNFLKKFGGGPPDPQLNGHSPDTYMIYFLWHVGAGTIILFDYLVPDIRHPRARVFQKRNFFFVSKC